MEERFGIFYNQAYPRDHRGSFCSIQDWSYVRQAILYGLQSGAFAEAPPFIRKGSTLTLFAPAVGGDYDPFSTSV
jgi:hypothetical protein